MLVTACGGIETSAPSGMLIVGHGGAGFKTASNPIVENSWTSIRKAVDVYEADGIEVDLQFTRDGVAVLFHDRTLEEATTCGGCLTALPYGKIKDCRYRHGVMANSTVDGRLVRLDELLRYMAKRRQTKLYLDTKTFQCAGIRVEDYEDDFIAELMRLTDRYGMRRRTSVQSGRLIFLQKLQSRGAGVSLILEGPGFAATTRYAKENGFDGVSFPIDGISLAEAREARKSKLRLIIYGVKSRVSTFAAFEMEPDVVQTENIPLVQSLAGRR